MYERNTRNISLYLVQIRENREQKNSEHKHSLHSKNEAYIFCFHLGKTVGVWDWNIPKIYVGIRGVIFHSTPCASKSSQLSIKAKDVWVYSGKLLEDFASFVESNVGEIVTIWEDPKTYKANCLRSIASENAILLYNVNFSSFRFQTGDASWGECIWRTSYLPSLDKKEVCKQFAFDLGPRRSSIRTKAESYWNPYKEKLVEPESIYSRIKQLVTGGSFNNALLNNIKSAEVRNSREIESLGSNRPG